MLGLLVELLSDLLFAFDLATDLFSLQCRDVVWLEGEVLFLQAVGPLWNQFSKSAWRIRPRKDGGFCRSFGLHEHVDTVVDV